MHNTLVATGLGGGAAVLLMLLTGGVMLCICFVAFLASLMGSRTIAIAAVAFLLIFTGWFLPLYLETTSEAEAYKSAGDGEFLVMNRLLGIGWLVPQRFFQFQATSSFFAIRYQPQTFARKQ